MTQKQAYYTRKGYIDHHHESIEESRREEHLIPLIDEAPEPVSPPSLAPPEDDPNTSTVDESLPLPEMRHQQYKYERQLYIKRCLKTSLWCVSIIFCLILVVLVRDFNKVVKGLDIELADATIADEGEQDAVFIENLKLDIKFTYLGWYKTVFEKGFCYHLLGSTRIDMPETTHWFSIGNTYKPLLKINTDGFEDTVKLNNATYQFTLSNTEAIVYKGVHKSLNNLFGSKEKVNLLFSTQFRLLGFSLPLWKKFGIQKTTQLKDDISNALDQLVISNVTINDYESNTFTGYALLKVNDFGNIHFRNFTAPANQLHIGTKIKNDFVKLATIESKEFELKDRETKLKFVIPKIDDRLIKSGFIQHLVDAYTNDERVEVWIKSGNCNDSWLCNLVNGIEVQLGVDPSNFGHYDLFHTFVPKLKTLGLDTANDAINLSSNLEILTETLKLPLNASVDAHIDVAGLHIATGGKAPLELNLESNRVNIDVNNLEVRIKNETEVLENIRGIIDGTISNFLFSFDCDSIINSAFVSGPLNFKIDESITLNKSNLIKMDDWRAQLYSAELVDADDESLVLLARVNVTNPLNLTITNDFPTIDIGVEYKHETPVASFTILPFMMESYQSTVIEVALKIHDDSPVSKHYMEELIGKYISKEHVAFDLRGQAIENSKSFSRMIQKVLVPINLPINDGSDDLEKQNEFILDTTMHIFSKEVELTVWNPIVNSNVRIVIYEAQASYEGTLLGYIEEGITLDIPSGVYTTPRLPVVYEQTGIAWTILQRALKSGRLLPVEVEAVVQISIHGYSFDLLYTGKRMLSKIRI